MEIVIKIQMNELSFVQDKSVYNKECYKVTPNIFGCGYLFATYDDVNGDPYIEIGDFVFGKFASKIQGYSNEIEKSKLGFGGVYVEVDVIRPDLNLTLK